MTKIIVNNNSHDFPGYMSVYIVIGAVANQQKMSILGDISTHQHQDNGKKTQTFPEVRCNFKYSPNASETSNKA